MVDTNRISMTRKKLQKGHELFVLDESLDFVLNKNILSHYMLIKLR